MNVAIIPARGGSKRIPRKNIKKFYGKPMIAYSIEVAIASEVFDRVIVSTDDNEIAEVAKKYGAEVPFIRPPELSDDHTATVPVIKHAIEQLQAIGGEVDCVCCIYATAPFVEKQDIKSAKELLLESGVDYVLPVTTFDYPIQRALIRDENNKIKMLYPENLMTRSQDLPETYHDSGQFYFGKAEAWIQEKPLLTGEVMCIKVERSKVQDIDTEEDWKQAEYMYRYLQEVR